MYLNHLEYHCAGGIFLNGEQNPARGDGSDNVYCFFSEVRKDAGENRRDHCPDRRAAFPCS